MQFDQLWDATHLKCSSLYAAPHRAIGAVVLAELAARRAGGISSRPADTDDLSWLCCSWVTAFPTGLF